MAEFKNELTLDVSQFLKGVKVALGAADELQDFTIELDTEALQGASRAFSDLANDAKKSVSDIENSLAAMVVAGKEGTDEFKQLSEQLDIARANAKKMDDALASIKAPKIELDAFEQLEADAKKAQSEVADVQKRLKAAIASGNPDGVVELRAELAKAESAAGELQGKLKEVSDAAQTVAPDESIGDKLKGAFSAAKGGDLGGLADIGSTLSGAIPALGAVTAAFGVVSGAIGDTIAKGKEFNDALRQVSLQTGLVGESLDKLESASLNAFQKGVGESAAEATKILGTLKQTLGEEIPVDQLDEAAIRANSVAKSLNVETTELVSKLSPLMKQYNLTFDEALEKVSAGSQKGIADLGGYLDAVNEFTVNAKEAGFGVDEFTASLEIAGEQGVKDLAKVGDGIKEIENRIKSGDLQAGFGAVSGQIGADLQNIAKLGAEGALSGKEVLQQSIETIDKAFQGKQISKNFRDNLLTQLGGSIAEDVGSEVFTNIFKKENIDKKVIEQSARNAGELIDANIPPPDLGRIFETVQTQIGQVFDTIYKQFIGPILVPILDGLGRIKDAFAEAFSGGGGLATDVLDTIAKLLSGVVSVAVERVVSVFTILADVVGAVFDGIKDAVSPVIDAFSELFAGAGEGVDIFETVNNVLRSVADVVGDVLAGAIKLALFPLKLLGQLTAFLIGVVKDVITTIADWVMGLGFVQDAIKFVSDAIDAFVGTIKAIGDAVGGFLESIGFIEKDAEAAAGGIAEVGEAAADTTEEVKSLTKGVNELAQEFNNALSAAQANLSNLIAAGAATGKYRKEIAAAAAAVRKLEAAQDAAALAGDPARQRAIQDSIAQAIAETARLDSELTASRIVNAQERERALLKIQQDADTASIEQQIATQKKIISIGGAGLPEARAALQALEEQKKRIATQGNADLIALEARFQQERLAALQSSEGLILSAFNAINDRVLAQAQKQLDARNLTSQNIDTLIDANVKAIKAGADAEVRALIESLPAFTEARKKIDESLRVGNIDADEANKQIKALIASFQNDLLADTGDNPIGQQVRAIFANAEDASREAAKGIKASIQDIGIQALSSEILRGIDSQVVALERQRDLLLQNTALTEEQRKEIESGYAKAIDKVRKGPLTGLRQSVIDIGTAIAGTQFDLGGEQAAADAAAVKEQVDAINEALREGSISYQEALDQINALQGAGEEFLSTFGDVLAQSLQATSEAVKTAAQASIDAYNQLLADQEKVRKDDTLSEEKRTEELARLSELTAEQQAKALESIGVAAGANFATLLAQGTEVGDALKALASDTVKSLVALYTPTIIAASTSFLGPIAGPIAAGLAIAGIQALLDSALASFDVGGATGGRIGEVRGIVHGGEWVARPDVYKENKGLLDHLHAGGSAMDFLGREAMSHSPSYAVNDAGSLVTIMSNINDTLGSLPAMVEVRQTDNVTLGLDDRLYERKRHKGMVRRLTR